MQRSQEQRANGQFTDGQDLAVASQRLPDPGSGPLAASIRRRSGTAKGGVLSLCVVRSIEIAEEVTL